MKYVKPSFSNEAVSSENVMAFSPENIKTTNTTFDFGSGEVNVVKGSSTANILDLLFGN